MRDSIIGNNSLEITLNSNTNFGDGISIQRFTKSTGSLTKHLFVNEHGDLEKDSSHCRMFAGRVNTYRIRSMSELSDLLQGLRKNEAIAIGTSDFSAGREIVAHSELPNHKEAIARTKEYFQFVEGQPAFLIFDRDSGDGQKMSRLQVLEILSDLIPGFEKLAILSTHSTTSFIYDAEGMEIAGEGNHHIYIPVSNGADISRFKKAFEGQCWLKGYGRASIAKTGKFLARTVFDLAVFSPERLIFEAGAELSSELTQKRPPPKFKEGAIFDTRLLRDLNKSEFRQVDQLKEQSWREVKDQIEQIKAHYDLQETKKMLKRGLRQQEIKRVLRARQSGQLDDQDLLYFDHLKGNAIAVYEVLAKPADFDGRTLAEPAEPDYMGQTGTVVKNRAKFYWNNGVRSVIHSQAHAGINYYFCSQLYSANTEFEDLVHEQLAEFLADELVEWSTPSELLDGISRIAIANKVTVANPDILDQLQSKGIDREVAERAILGMNGASLQFSSGSDLENLFSDVILTEEDVSKMSDAKFLIDNVVVLGSLHSFVAPANGGKTTLFIYLCEELAAKGMEIYYINADASPSDLKRHFNHAQLHGYKVVAPDAKPGMGSQDIVDKLERMNSGEVDPNNVVIVLDTLKKFTDVINKSQIREFLKLMRSITAKGATFIMLSHTNKYKDSDGKPIYEGTGDLRNDVDHMIYLESQKDEALRRQIITTRPDKVRANFTPVSFSIDLDTREVKRLDQSIPLMNKDERAVAELAKEAIASGHIVQRALIEYINEFKIGLGEKKIRSILERLSQGDSRIFDTKRGEKFNSIIYSIRNQDVFDETSYTLDQNIDYIGLMNEKLAKHEKLRNLQN